MKTSHSGDRGNKLPSVNTEDSTRFALEALEKRTLEQWGFDLANQGTVCVFLIRETGDVDLLLQQSARTGNFLRFLEEERDAVRFQGSNETSASRPLQRRCNLSFLLCRELEPTLSKLPPALAKQVRSLFATSFPAADSPKSLAYKAGMSRRSMDRHISHAGIVSTRRLFIAARVSQGLTMLSLGKASRRRIGKEPGCSSFRALERQCVCLTGFPLSTIVRTVDEATFVKLALAGLLRCTPP